ncbi:MAG TPA: bifunctional proline dehydrogenase/L-glutamate gamma-semialdehyde dehydrogenase PutA [Alphaproteobacteria bacterium]
MILAPAATPPSPSRLAVRAATRADETACVRSLAREAALPVTTAKRIHDRAYRLAGAVRADEDGHGGIDSFLRAYDLTSREGVALMCLAEALLRIPDADTVDRLIRDKIGGVDWHRKFREGESLFVNASTWGLMLTGRVVRLEAGDENHLGAVLARFLARSSEPVIRAAVTRAMRILARQFVIGRTIEEALAQADEAPALDTRFSFDMLGEAACTAADAERYFEAYLRAVEAVGASAGGRGPVEGPGLSVKLSALHPRYEFAQSRRVMAELVPRLVTLAEPAAAAGLGLTVDAEEADRLEPSLDVVEALASAPKLAGWDGLGVAVQAYQKRARPLIDWLADLARRTRRRLMVRLVKGAYWDTEIKRAQERGLDGYPVFTRKAATDVSYLACARAILAHADAFFAQFASHNVQTVAAIVELAGRDRPFEFQRLFGMGDALYRHLAEDGKVAVACRVYAPVGSHEELLPYLVRRLLENGANSSFVNRIHHRELPIESVIADPAARLARLVTAPHPAIPLPVDLYPDRRNSRGIDLADPGPLAELGQAMAEAAARTWRAAPIVGGKERDGNARQVRDPARQARVVGEVVEADAAAVDEALGIAAAHAPDWDASGGEARAQCLERAGDLIEEHRAELMALCVREAGKTIAAALAEVREAADYCRYYASQARRLFAAPLALPGPTGERNELTLAGRGTFACISPWNFPLAIFTGQVSAALVAGNSVIAKPAQQTPLIAAAAVRLLHQAGVPAQVLHLLPGAGETVGARLVGDARIDGVAVTGGTDTAQAINRGLAARPGSIVPLIAETGGQNAMIVDSSALAEQVVRDALASAFDSAGQRCSALRVLFLQDDIAGRLIDMLAGAMDELVVGDPARLETDVGPVIDDEAWSRLDAHARRMAVDGRLIRRAPAARDGGEGIFFSPMAFEIDSVDALDGEVFGPILHVLRYRSDRLDAVIDAVNRTGYGLTLGVHSRIEETARRVIARARVGNIYVNRNMIGAVVGAQPFGGEGLSGTGPKAGGPHYLLRFAVERATAVDTTAAGGNASLLAIDDTADA